MKEYTVEVTVKVSLYGDELVGTATCVCDVIRDAFKTKRLTPSIEEVHAHEKRPQR